MERMRKVHQEAGGINAVMDFELQPFSPAVHDSAQVARLIYKADPLLMRFVLGNEEQAVPTLTKLIAGEHNEYAGRRIRCAVRGGEPAGILIGVTGEEKRASARGSGQEWASAVGLGGVVRAVRYGSKLAKIATGDISDSEYYIAALTVDERFRRQGVASLLMSEVSREHESIIVDVNIDNGGAIHFYERNGFRISETKTFRHKGATFGNHQMRRGGSETS